MTKKMVDKTGTLMDRPIVDDLSCILLGNISAVNGENNIYKIKYICL